MKSSCRYCRPSLFVPLFALLAFAGLVGSCGTVQGDVRRRALSALQAEGLSGIQVDVGYRDVSMSGPPDLEAGALAAVSALDATHQVTYTAVGAPGVAPTVGSTGASTTTATVATTAAAAPSIRIAGSITADTITLTGSVPDESVHAAIVDAASAAYGVSGVTDQIAVAGTPATREQVAAAEGLAPILASLAGNLDAGRLELTDTGLTLTGTAADTDGLDAITEAVSSAAGLEITANVGAAPAAVIDSLSQLLALRPIMFETNSDVITPDSQATLDKAVQYLTAAFTAEPGLVVEIGGHTDNRGDPTYNLDLSNRRAAAVLRYLTDHGVTAAGLTAVGYGMDKPIASNDTAEGRAQNRRIEFTRVEG
jgi:OOP family OmpA-OmpF porin